MPKGEPHWSVAKGKAMSKIRLVNDEVFGVGFQGDVRVWIG